MIARFSLLSSASLKWTSDVYVNIYTTLIKLPSNNLLS